MHTRASKATQAYTCMHAHAQRQGHTCTPAAASPHPPWEPGRAGRGPGAQAEPYCSMPGPRWVSTVRDPPSAPEGPCSQASVGHRLLILLEKLGLCRVPLPQILPGEGVFPPHSGLGPELQGLRSLRGHHAARSPSCLHGSSRARPPSTPETSSSDQALQSHCIFFLPSNPSFWFSFLFFFLSPLHFFFNAKDPGLTSCEPRGTFISPFARKAPPPLVRKRQWSLGTWGPFSSVLSAQTDIWAKVTFPVSRSVRVQSQLPARLSTGPFPAQRGQNTASCSRLGG